MYSKLFLLVCIFYTSVNLVLGSSSSGYPFSAIPDSMKLNANAVIRENSITFTYHSSKLTTYTEHIVVTVLNNSGDEFGEYKTAYDRFTKSSFIKGNLYNAEGQLIKKIKSSEIKDISYSSESALYNDYRIQFFQPLLSSYPYTVEYEYESEIHGSYSFPKWIPVDNYNLALQGSSFTIIVPTDYSFRYIENGIRDKPVISNEGKNKKYHWEISNIKAFRQESFSPSALKIFPNVLSAPSDFELGGYKGNMESWQNYAKWIAMLNAGRDKLSPATLVKINELVKGTNDEKEKIRIIYKFLQSRTRYVGIQLGIGGLQPIEASVVDEVGYGDCKALSNYAVALLKAVGIKAYYSLIKSGSSFPRIIEDFPSHQFDHVIVCIPLKKDTIWLECTSQIDPFNYLGDFTSDRKVLLIKENGGELVNTRIYPLKENYQYTTARVDLNYNGNAKSTVAIRYGGLLISDVIGYIHLGRDDQKKWLYHEINIPNFQLGNYALSHDSADKPEALIRVDMQLNNYAAESGRRLFIPLNLLTHSEYIPSRSRERKQNIVVAEPFIKLDTIEYRLPAGVDLEFVPEPVSLTTDFGEYYTTVALNKSVVTYIRKFLFYKGEYPPSKYSAFQKFFHDISDGDNTRLVLLKTSY